MSVSTSQYLTRSMYGVGMKLSPKCPIGMFYKDGLLQDCSISSELAMEILQSCTKSFIYENTMVVAITSYMKNDLNCPATVLH